MPQAMAYAMLAGMPPIYGLYGALVPLMIYALLGSSTRLSIGPVAVSSLLILAGVSALAKPETQSYVELVLLLGLMIGVIQLTLGLFRFGFLINYLSHPVISGFISAAAIIIIISQFKDLTGLTLPRSKNTFSSLQLFFTNISNIHIPTLVIGISSLALLFIINKISEGFPTALLLVILGTVLSYFFNWNDIGVPIIGKVPEGLPQFYLPSITQHNLLLLLPIALSVSIIGIVESIGIGKTLETRHKDHILIPNQELVALGTSKIIGSFWQAIPGSGSFGRSAINSAQEAKSQLSNLIAASIVLLTLLFLTRLFHHMPKAILAAIIFQTVMGLFDFKEAKYLWQLHKWDFTMWIVTFAITLLLGIEEGVATGVILSLLAVLYRTSKPHVSIMGQVLGTTYYRNLDRFEDAQRIENMLILRFDGSLYFGNSNFFKEKIRELLSDRPNTKNVLIDTSPISSIDSSAITALRDLDKELQSQGIHLYLCGTIGPIRDILAKEGLMSEPHKHHMDVHSAVQFVNKNIISIHQSKATQNNN